MCGIIGAFNTESLQKIVSTGLDVMKNRGLDGSDIKIDSKIEPKGMLGHNLHAIVDLVVQPLVEEDYIFVTNCEIYNWKELNEKYTLGAQNDAQTLMRLLIAKGVSSETLAELDGVYAFCLYNTVSQKAYLARDIFGVKPLWISFSQFLAFASEKKALMASELYDTYELHPRQIAEYDVSKNSMTYEERPFFEVMPEHTDSEEMKKQTQILIRDAIQKRLTDQKVGVLFSGGIDSVYIAYMLKKLGVEFTCYTAALTEQGMEKAEDLIYAEKAAEQLGLKLKVIHADLAETEAVIKELIPLIETTNVVKVGVALPFYLCCKKAREDGIRVMYSGLGSEEIFAGYERHEKSSNVNNECLSGLRKMHERDLYRDDVVTMANTIELRLPFLDKTLAAYALRIPAKYKLVDEHKKVILRNIADDIGIPKEFSWRQKKAAQYGSKFDRAIQKLAKKHDFDKKAGYLNSLTTMKNARLGVLWSSGKDSAYSAYLMKRHNYDIACLMTIESKNKYSFMFHTPNVSLAGLQAQAMQLPLLTCISEGEKEDELSDMKKLMLQAKEEHNIDGVIVGALFSQYQRERVEKVAEEIGLKTYAPLWHKNQAQEMKELMDEGFKVILSSVAAEGLDDSWLGRVLDHADVDKLSVLGEKIGLNVAGEGGEFESLVIDCPLFDKRIEIIDSEIVHEEGLNYFFVVNDAKLVEK